MWRAAVATLASYHQLDYRQLGFARLEQTDRTPLQQQLAYWRDYLDWAMEGAGHAIGQRALDWLQANQPADEPIVLCLGRCAAGHAAADRPALL